MKIIIQSFNLFPHELGGAEKSARELANGLRRAGHEVGFLISDGSKPYPDELDGMKLSIVEGMRLGKSPLWPERSFWQRMLWILRSEVDPLLLWRLVRYLRREKPDAVLINNPAGHGSALMLAAKLTGTQAVPVYRDYGWFCAFGVMLKGEKACEGICASCRKFSTMRRAMVRRAPLSIAISQHMQKTADSLAGVKGAVVIHNSIPDVFFERPRPDHKAAPPVAGQPLTFGFIGRIHPTKGVVQLLEAWQQAGLAAAGHRLVLAGDIQEGFGREDLLKAPGVSYLGRQDGISFIDRLDILVVPALWAEPFGRTIAEALVRGVYTVAGPLGATRELIPEGCGETLPQVSVPQIAGALSRLASTFDPARVQQCFASHQDFINRFRARRMIGEYDATLRAHLSSRAG